DGSVQSVQRGDASRSALHAADSPHRSRRLLAHERSLAGFLQRAELALRLQSRSRAHQEVLTPIRAEIVSASSSHFATLASMPRFQNDGSRGSSPNGAISSTALRVPPARSRSRYIGSNSLPKSAARANSDCVKSSPNA